MPLPAPLAAARPTPVARYLLTAGPGNAPPQTTVRVPALDHINPGQGSNSLPGVDLLHGIASALGSWGLIAAVVGIFVGGVMWAFGSYSQNYQQAYSGRRGVLVSGLAALLIGAGPYLVNFFYGQGQGVR